jgi:hypothetical protein
LVALAIVWGTLDYFNDWLTVTDLRVVHHEELALYQRVAQTGPFGSKESRMLISARPGWASSSTMAR